jgi:hypothetical protein
MTGNKLTLGKLQSNETKDKRASKHRGMKRPKSFCEFMSKQSKSLWANDGYRNKVLATNIERGNYIKSSELMKQKIKDGVWYPNIQNRLTKFGAVEFNGKKFRSSWEAMFWSLNPHLEYETVIIPYQFKNNHHSYIVDFVDYAAKIIYEIKPSSEMNKPKIQAKLDAAEKWAVSNKYTFLIVNESWFIGKEFPAGLEKYAKQFK